MSRIGKMPITVPAGVTVTVSPSNLVTVKGPLGELKEQIDKKITVKQEGATITLTRADELKPTKAKHGLYRALIFNMVKGVKEGFSKKLVLNGVGYKAAKQGDKLVLNVGLSHTVEVLPPAGITFECPAVTEVVVKGFDKAAVGQCASMIRAKRKPEPYHAYGIRYSDEVIQKKEGKTAGK